AAYVGSHDVYYRSSAEHPQTLRRHPADRRRASGRNGAANGQFEATDVGPRSTRQDSITLAGATMRLGEWMESTPERALAAGNDRRAGQPARRPCPTGVGRTARVVAGDSGPGGHRPV